jgi:hypothetical protein
MPSGPSLEVGVAASSSDKKGARMVTTPDSEAQLGHDVATLRVHRAGRIDTPRVCAALSSASWLGDPIGAEGLPAGTTRYLTDLVFPLPPDGRLLSFKKAAYVDLGSPSPLKDGGCEAAVAWRSASLAPLFPVFAGRLLIRPTGVALEGHYAPPGGAVGRAADRMLLNTAARGTARWFLEHLVAEARGVAQTPG